MILCNPYILCIEKSLIPSPPPIRLGLNRSHKVVKITMILGVHVQCADLDLLGYPKKGLSPKP